MITSGDLAQLSPLTARARASDLPERPVWWPWLHGPPRTARERLLAQHTRAAHQRALRAA